MQGATHYVILYRGVITNTFFSTAIYPISTLEESKSIFNRGLLQIDWILKLKVRE